MRLRSSGNPLPTGQSHGLCLSFESYRPPFRIRSRHHHEDCHSPPCLVARPRRPAGSAICGRRPHRQGQIVRHAAQHEAGTDLSAGCAGRSGDAGTDGTGTATQRSGCRHRHRRRCGGCGSRLHAGQRHERQPDRQRQQCGRKTGCRRQDGGRERHRRHGHRHLAAAGPRWLPAVPLHPPPPATATAAADSGRHGAAECPRAAEPERLQDQPDRQRAGAADRRRLCPAGGADPPAGRYRSAALRAPGQGYVHAPAKHEQPGQRRGSPQVPDAGAVRTAARRHRRQSGNRRLPAA